MAELAAAGVSGADPDSWWGVGELSDERGLIDADESARVSPSKIDAYNRCALKAFLDSYGASEDDSAKAALGSAVHEIAELADASGDLLELEAMMDARWAGLDFGAPWYDRVERKRASVMLERLSTWLTSSRRDLRLVARELDFRVELDDVVLSGQVDRLEVDAEGRPVVIDLKTSKTPVSPADLAEHLQLAAYQVAIEAGGFAEVVGSDESGGAALVELGSPRKDIEKRQPPLDAGARSGPDPPGDRGRRRVAARPPLRRHRQQLLPDVFIAPGVPGPAGPAGDRMTTDRGRIGALELAELLQMPAPTDEQVEVIEAGPGPAVVIAGAGSGKTETMASRVVWLVANGLVPADAVLGPDVHPQGGHRARRPHPPPDAGVGAPRRTRAADATAGGGTDRAHLRRLLRAAGR